MAGSLLSIRLGCQAEPPRGMARRTEEMGGATWFVEGQVTSGGTAAHFSISPRFLRW
jgi:hypothetical protein